MASKITSLEDYAAEWRRIIEDRPFDRAVSTPPTGAGYVDPRT